MCIFSFAYYECNHRGEDHIDTSSCRYFAKRGVHCQEDNTEHRERPGGVVFSNKKGRIHGKCISCFREEKDRMECAMANSMKTAKEEDDRRRRAEEERERAGEEARQERKRKEQERADEIEKARLAKDDEKKRDNEKRAAAAEKRQRELDDKAKRDAERKAELKQRKKDAERAEKRRQRELAEAEEDIRRQEDLDNIEREKEAKHRQELRQKHEDANRRRAERDEAERQEVAEQRKREKAELERRQKDIDDQNQILARETREAKDREDAAERAKRFATMEASDAAAKELERKLAPRRIASETKPTPLPPTEQTSPVARPPPPSNKPALDISGVIGHHGSQEIGYGMLGGRRIPLHESQRKPEPPKTPLSPPIKRGPAPINRLSGTIASSPHDYKIQQPSLVTTPGTPTPDWTRNIRKPSVAKPIPAPESRGVDAELAAKLAKQKAWEAEQETLEASKASQERAEPDWEMVNKPSSNTTTPAHPTPSAPQTPATLDSPPPTYPVVPPLAHPKLTTTPTSSPPPAAKPKPPVPVKRMSSTSSAQVSFMPAQTPFTSQKPSTSHTASIPIPPPIASLPSHLRRRVDSAAPSPQVGGNKKSGDWDDSGSESESEGEGRFGGDGSWDERVRVSTKAFNPDDVFGEQRRKGWKVA